ncbi:unnamed protein product [Brachionus calyciflorus]|uniref:Transmembrane protein adipocyte-associated 1 n=1 Tax=Brachionus calyciflorus TaxID=104777 RepID=A0A814JXX6_9BILA|nr:unnamed protein product [Brachionus calyciflorus]
MDFFQSLRSNYDPPDNGSWYPADFVPFCLRIQTYSILNKFLLWDLILLIPNVIFAIFLLFKSVQMKEKLKQVNFPIIKVFYYLILILSMLSIFRCIISIFVKPNHFTGEILNKIVWLIVRFGQLGTELSVVFFGLFFARLESKKSIMRIMYLTIPISLLYISIQASLEFLFPDKHYKVSDRTSHYYDLFGHGGMIFWFVSSALFTMIYLIIFILPFTKLREKFPIPQNRGFYIYCLTLSLICLSQAIGSLLVYLNIGENVDGLCVLDLTTFLYFTLYGPLVYWIYLRKFFRKESMFPNQYSNSGNYNSTTSLNSSLSSASRKYNNFRSQSRNWHLSADSSIQGGHTSQRYTLNQEYFDDYAEYDDKDDDTKVIIVKNIN